MVERFEFLDGNGFMHVVETRILDGVSRSVSLQIFDQCETSVGIMWDPMHGASARDLFGNGETAEYPSTVQALYEVTEEIGAGVPELVAQAFYRHCAAL